MAAISTRAKFRCNSVIEAKYTDSTTGEERKYQEQWQLSPVYDPDPNSENGKFWKSSPSGYLSLSVDNPGAWGAVQVGKEFYLDITPAD